MIPPEVDRILNKHLPKHISIITEKYLGNTYYSITDIPKHSIGILSPSFRIVIDYNRYTSLLDLLVDVVNPPEKLINYYNREGLDLKYLNCLIMMLFVK